MNRRSLLGGAALAATTALVIRQSKASHVPQLTSSGRDWRRVY